MDRLSIEGVWVQPHTGNADHGRLNPLDEFDNRFLERGCKILCLDGRALSAQDHKDHGKLEQSAAHVVPLGGTAFQLEACVRVQSKFSNDFFQCNVRSGQETSPDRIVWSHRQSPSRGQSQGKTRHRRFCRIPHSKGKRSTYDPPLVGMT
jgi:hypothetical protein